ncbi:ribonuclease H-like domain-containing protein [Sphaerosporella brunnea]|uniref:ribonuclease H n=1 Tax=Sphaerosporella brunnea TaxID=1250544 RepID=A0A5J5F968_9PEZI|nr:ribonuclease H-like domain-containing protein [Sphaerosporella brunnea]
MPNRIIDFVKMALPRLSVQALPAGRPDYLHFPHLYRYPAVETSYADGNRRFFPPRENMRPIELFAVRYNVCTVPGFRFIRTNNRQQMLMFIDGACSNNGNPEACGGCGVVYTSTHFRSGIAYPLEKDGTQHTNNRAVLRAAILALEMRLWNGEGFNKVVLACDSEYVVKGVSEWLSEWVINGWKTSDGTAVKNKDLWEILLETLRRQESRGVLVQFWLIPREWNEADEYAKKGSVSDSLFLPRGTRKLMVLPPGQAR